MGRQARTRPDDIAVGELKNPLESRNRISGTKSGSCCNAVSNLKHKAGKLQAQISRMVDSLGNLLTTKRAIEMIQLCNMYCSKALNIKIMSDCSHQTTRTG